MYSIISIEFKRSYIHTFATLAKSRDFVKMDRAFFHFFHTKRSGGGKREKRTGCPPFPSSSCFFLGEVGGGGGFKLKHPIFSSLPPSKAHSLFSH